MPEAPTIRPAWTEARLYGLPQDVYDNLARTVLRIVSEAKGVPSAEKERIVGLERGAISRHVRGLTKSKIKVLTVIRVMTEAPLAIRKEIHDATALTLAPQPELADTFELLASVHSVPGACSIAAAAVFAARVQELSKHLVVSLEGTTLHVKAEGKKLSTWEFYRDFKSDAPGRVAFSGLAHKSYAFTGTANFGPMPFSNATVVAATNFIRSHAWPKN